MNHTDDFFALTAHGITVQPGLALAQCTTFQLGGPCPMVIHCQTPGQIQAAVRHLDQRGAPFLLLGGGSNVLVSDEGVSIPVIRYASPTPIIQREGEKITVSGSTNLDHLAAYAAENGLAGLSCANGIPGTVGGAIVGNAGAFGKQVSDHLHGVRLLSQDGVTGDLPAADLQFSYRQSRLKAAPGAANGPTREIVLTATFLLLDGDRAQLLQERQDILLERRAKHPDYTALPCAGSFFRNIEPSSKAERRQAAGWFLEQAGAKAMRENGATVFDRHANIIVKTGPCSAADVYRLACRMQTAVREHFQIDLLREVLLVGRFDDQGQTDRLW